MLTALPEQPLPLLVALKTRGVPLRRGVGGLGTEPDTVRGIRLVFQVLAARTMTRLAVVLLEGRPTSLPKHPTVQCGIELLELILVALLAGLASHVGRAGDC